MNNFVNETEVKEIVYHEVRQYFTESNKTNGFVKEDYFRIKPKKEKVIHSDNATIVILDNGEKGIAKCNPEDNFDKTKGIKIAYIRAKIKSLEKELKELTK